MLLFPPGTIHDIHEQFLHGKTPAAIESLSQFLEQDTISQEDRLTASALHAFYLIFTGKVNESKIVLQTTLSTALENEMWLQVGYAYLVSAEIQIRTGHYKECLKEAKKTIEILQKLNNSDQSSLETMLIQGVSFYYQIRALVEKYSIWNPTLMLDLIVSNQERFDASIHEAELTYQKALQLNHQIKNPYLEVMLWGNFAWLLNIKYFTVLGTQIPSISDLLLPDPQKREMMAAFFQWYSTAKTTQFQWQLARYFQYGNFPEDWYTFYGYKILEIEQWSGKLNDWVKHVYKLFRHVGDALWTSLYTFIHHYQRDFDRTLKSLKEIYEPILNALEQLQNYHHYLYFLNSYYYRLIFEFGRSSENLQIQIQQKFLQMNPKHNEIFPELLSCNFSYKDGYLKYHQGDSSASIQIFTKIRSIAEDHHFPHEIVLSNRYLGQNYMMIGDFDKAEKNFAQVLPIAEKYGFSFDFHRILVEFGILYYKQGDYTKSVQTFEKITYSKLDNNHYSIGKLLLYQIKTNIALGNLEQSQKYLEEFHTYQQEFPEPFVSDCYHLAQGIILKQSDRMKQKVEAQAIFEELITKDSAEFELLLQARFQLIDLLLLEYRISLNQEILQDIVGRSGRRFGCHVRL